MTMAVACRSSLVSAILVLAGCAGPQSGVGVDLVQRPTPTPEPMQIDWDEPVDDGVRMSSPAEAGSLVGFSPPSPRGLGPAKLIVVSPGPESERAFKVLGFVYDSPEYGRVIVRIGLDHVSMAERAASNQAVLVMASEPSATGIAEIVLIRSNIEALMTFSELEPFSDIRWREGALLFYVAGPMLEKDQLIAIAEHL